MNDPCRLELRGLSGSEPCGACNHPARDHRGHREYVEPEYWTVEYMIGNSDWISHGLGVYTTRDDAEKALKSCSISDDRIRIARCDASSRIIGAVVEPVMKSGVVARSTPDITMSQEAYDAAIAEAKREGWSRAVIKLRDGHRFVQASDCLARTIPDAWPTPPNPLTKIASAMGCDENEAACLDAIDSLRRELECSEDASSMERQRRKDAELTRDAAVNLASNRGEQVSRLTAELAKALEAAPARGFPEALREQIAAWDQLRSGCRSAHDLIRDVHAWLASQPADETEALRARVRELETERDAAVDLASNRGEQVSRLTAELAKALEAAPARGFPSDLRRSVRAVVRGATFESASSVLTNINDWLTSQPADETAALRARVRELETERDAAYGRGIEEAFRVVCEEAPCIARVRDESGDWTDAIGRRETYLAIRALADRGAK